MVAETEVRYMITEAGRRALQEQTGPVGRNNSLERTIYGWVNVEDADIHVEWCRLKAEAKADAPDVPMSPTSYLAASLYESTRSYLGLDGPEDPQLSRELVRVAVEAADFAVIADWVMRNDADWPAPEVGDLEESQE